MQPASLRKTTASHFRGVDERAFVGGGMEMLDSDVGLWIHDHGKLRLSGSPRSAWTRSTGPCASRQLISNPPEDGRLVTTNWSSLLQKDHEREDASHANSYDCAQIRAISGKTVRLARPLASTQPL
jgi:hypothetical protein